MFLGLVSGAGKSPNAAREQSRRRCNELEVAAIEFTGGPCMKSFNISQLGSDCGGDAVQMHSSV